jgi:excinuclease ABC subunit A
MVMTYTGIADLLRKIFASSAAAKEKGYSASHFSVHQPGGRCELCKGNGFIPVTMDFLPDVELPCSECEGKRFLPSVLEVRVGAGNICDFMNMTLNEMSPVLGNMSQKEVVNIKRAMQSLLDAGLGHLVAGQRLSSLSGGEWQRLQLAMALKELKAPAVILLDEPGNGMSLSDIRVLGELFVKLAGEGHAVIFTEHRPELIRYSGWNTDLGIGGGDAGGTLLYCGPTSGLRHCKDSVTAKFL